MATVPAADRTLRVFEAFERHLKPLSLSRLAEEIDAPISSCHGLVHTLINRGYLFSLDRQRSLYPTRKLWELAESIVAHDPLLEHLLPMIENLRNQTSETVIVGKRQGELALYLHVLEGIQTIRYVAHPGDRKPLYSSAIGKALLGSLGAREFDKLVKLIRLQQVTNKTIATIEELRNNIRRGQKRGYFTTMGENVPDVGAIAMPLTLGDETLAIAIAGPVARINANRQNILRALNGCLLDLQRIAS